jgi:hypothetical protein
VRVNSWSSEGYPDKPGSRAKDNIAVSEAKRLLREEGGTACTCFFDRDGSFVETRDIQLKGNNVGLRGEGRTIPSAFPRLFLHKKASRTGGESRGARSWRRNAPLIGGVHMGHDYNSITGISERQAPLCGEERDICFVESLNQHIKTLKNKIDYLQGVVEEQRDTINELRETAKELEDLILIELAQGGGYETTRM